MTHDTPNRALAAALLKLDGVTDWERRDRGSGMLVGLEPLRDLLDHLGRPQHSFRTVHVAGTKGKGSVAALIEAGLHRAGLRVGRFSSPHIERITERVSFGGQEISENAFAASLELAWTARQGAARRGGAGRNATRFDLETLAAILAFAEARVDWVVLECGMGGRTDSTNTVDAEVAVLTNVELEHTAVLGTTHAAIAHQKVGILKPGATLVTGVAPDSEAGAVVRAEAQALACPVLFRPPAGDGLTIAESNAGLARAVLDELGRRGVEIRGTSLPPGPLAGWLLDDVTRRAAQLPGRMERFDLPVAALTGSADGVSSRFVPAILDCAHVPFSLEAVLADLDGIAELAGPCAVVFGLGRDKQARAMLDMLWHRTAVVVCTQATGGPPAFSPTELCSLAEGAGLAAEAIAHPEDALARAVMAVPARGWILVTGSLHIVGEVRPILRRMLDVGTAG
jgi:dihydrofolate synthase/folylpolyglutamate synthase